ncbi:hypothetical protein F4604DRAFT_1582957 [Suillus subluteus]|nr:hypothetical protein F4604DRAFT_1582957 [Suillus subluteus]
MLVLSKLRKFHCGEVDLDDLTHHAEESLGRKPFTWQLEAAATVLKGYDVVLDVGTGSGKTICFYLPLLIDETESIGMVVSPLMALMIDQV